LSAKAPPPAIPKRILYTMLRVGELDRSIAFYRDGLGLREIRRETFSEGRFTLVFMGYDHESIAIELTCNWGETGYRHGNGFGHIALAVADVHAACGRLARMGIKILRAPGPMTFASDETGLRENIAFIEDPDGYRIELVETD
jgi:lactoylglutathione lyase